MQKLSPGPNTGINGVKWIHWDLSFVVATNRSHRFIFAPGDERKTWAPGPNNGIIHWDLSFFVAISIECKTRTPAQPVKLLVWIELTVLSLALEMKAIPGPRALPIQLVV